MATGREPYLRHEGRFDDAAPKQACHAYVLDAVSNSHEVVFGPQWLAGTCRTKKKKKIPMPLPKLAHLLVAHTVDHTSRGIE